MNGTVHNSLVPVKKSRALSLPTSSYQNNPVTSQLTTPWEPNAVPSAYLSQIDPRSLIIIIIINIDFIFSDTPLKYSVIND